MKRFFPILCCLGVLACTAWETGFSQPGREKNPVQQIVDLNQNTSREVGKNRDLAELKKIMAGHRQKRTAISDKIKNFPKDQLEKALRDSEKDFKVSMEQLGKALAQFHQRLNQGQANPVVVMKTSMGTVKIELFEKSAPFTVKNFLAYVDDKFYDGTIFHRVIADFMIQGGGFFPGMKKEKGTKDPIENEAYNGLANDRGTIAMARTGDPNSATAQFYINVKNNNGLNQIQARDGYGYAVFGKVIEGMDVVDKIRNVKTDTKGDYDDVPVQDVVIESIRRVKKGS